MLLFMSWSLSAQSDKPNDWKLFKSYYKTIKNEPGTYLAERFGFPQWEIDGMYRTALGRKMYREISLRSFDSEQLNDLENELLQKHSDVVVALGFRCYFTIDDDGSIGIVSPTGKEVVPQIAGRIRHHVRSIIIDEQSEDFDDVQAEYYVGSCNSNFKVAYSLGLGKAILRFTMSGVDEIIPYNKYDYVSVIPKGMLGLRGYYMCKVDDSGDVLWGVCDKNGREIVPCEYKGVVFNNGKFIGVNNRKMEDIEAGYEQLIAYKRELRQRRAALWSEALGALGESMIGVGMAMQQSQSSSAGVSAGDSSSKASGGVDYLAQYRRWERIAERHYNSITNLGTSVKYDDGSKSGSAGQSMSPANYTSMKKSYREAQQEMARIRREAAQAGVSIPQSPWETNTISY